MKIINKIAITALTVTLLAGSPLAALAQTQRQPTPEVREQLRFAHETEEQLINMGCEKASLDDKQSISSALSINWYVVIPVNTDEKNIMLCSPTIVQELKPLNSGEALGAMEAGKTLLNMMPWWHLWKAAAKKIGSKAEEAAQGATTVVLKMIADAGKKIANFLAPVIVPLLTISEFEESSVVQTLWPVMLGIANLGFLLALIVIALLVTLRLDYGGGIRKLLPRLLIGALLVNFSLIISAAIIDLSRLLMAIIANIFDMSPFTEDKLFGEIWHNSGINFLGIDLVRLFDDNIGNWDTALVQLIEGVFVWGVLICILVVIVALVIRYFALLLLLTLSPFAYLALAFPNAQKFASTWWSYFLRYVIYGPVVLTLIIIAAKTPSLLPPDMFDLTNKAESAQYRIIQAIVFGSGMVFAALAGRFAGIAGSNMTLNLVSRGGKKARSLAYSGAKGTAKGTLKGAYVGSGTRFAARSARNQARDFGRTAKGNISKRLGFAKRDEKGNLKKGQKSWGSRWAEKATGGDTQKKTQARSEAGKDAGNKMVQAGQNISPASLENKRFNTANLRNKDFAVALHNQDQIGTNHAGNLGKFVNLSKNKSRLQTILGNEELMKELNEEQRIELAINLENNNNFSGEDKAKFTKTMHDAWKRADKAKSGDQSTSDDQIT